MSIVTRHGKSMVISISITSTVQFQPASPALVMEDTIGYISSHAEGPPAIQQVVPVAAKPIPSVEPNPVELSGKDTIWNEMGKMHR